MLVSWRQSCRISFVDLKALSDIIVRAVDDSDDPVALVNVEVGGGGVDLVDGEVTVGEVGGGGVCFCGGGVD